MAVTGEALAAVQRRFAVLAPRLDERRRRLLAAAEALALGWGGIAGVLLDRHEIGRAHV